MKTFARSVLLLVKFCLHQFQLVALQPSWNTVLQRWRDSSSSARGRCRRTNAHECINSRKILRGKSPSNLTSLSFPAGAGAGIHSASSCCSFSGCRRMSRFLLAALQPPPAGLCALEVAPLQRLSTSFFAISGVSVQISGSSWLSLSALARLLARTADSC